MIREQTEERYRQLEQLGAELGVPVPVMHHRAEIDGVEVYKGRSHTWVRNFWNLFLMLLGYQAAVASEWGPGIISRKNLTGTIVAAAAGGTGLTATAAANGWTAGIVVGNSATDWSFGHYALQSVAQGSMTVSSQLAPGMYYNSDTKMWTITFQRTFTNSSGSTYTIREAGLYYITITGSTAHMMCRDVLETEVPVLNGQVITWTSTLTLTFPE